MTQYPGGDGWETLIILGGMALIPLLIFLLI